MAEVSKTMIEAAKNTDPTYFLESHGYFVRKQYGYLSVRDSNKNGGEVYRVSRLANGRYVFCDKTGSEGGDNIKLVSEIAGVNFREAISLLLNCDLKKNDFDAIEHAKKQPPPPPPRKPPEMPSYTDDDVFKGRAYLAERGISNDSICFAETVGFLRYGHGGVFFCGLDEQGQVQSATRRAIDKSEFIQKRDLKGSDKSYAGILRGNPKKVWIVEGGTDALALIDIAMSQGERPAPTIIISGGANTTSWIEKPHIKSILQAAEKITIAFENEKDQETQERTNKAHRRQASIIEELTKIKVHEFKPKPEYGKDLADLNLYKKQKAKELSPNIECSR